MTRTKVCKRNRQQLRQEADRDERLRLAQVKIDSALEKIDELGKSYVQQVSNQLQLILARTNQHLLQMKWGDFLKLQLQHFEDFKWSVPAPPTRVRSQSTIRSSRQRTPGQPMQPRGQIQSVDRAVLKRDDTPAMAILRWPKPGEVALSMGGSPLAVHSFPDRFANVHIPTKAGVLKVKPHKLNEVKSEVLRQLDASTLNQIKTLNSNLCMILDMSNKLIKR